MKKLLALLFLLVVVSCSKIDETSHVKYLECVTESNRPIFIKIDTKEQYVEMLGVGFVFDKDWTNDGVFIKAHDEKTKGNITIALLSGYAWLIVPIEPTSANPLSISQDRYSECKAIQSILD